jgi:hypothetical protein
MLGASRGSLKEERPAQRELTSTWSRLTPYDKGIVVQRYFQLVEAPESRDGQNQAVGKGGVVADQSTYAVYSKTD